MKYHNEYNNNWHVNSNLDLPKKDNEYDVIIIGSGPAGLSCGVTLTTRGYKVLILEHHYNAGGGLGSFNKNDFIFNNTVLEMNGLWEKGEIVSLLKEANLNQDEFFIQNTSVTKMVKDGKEINLSYGKDNLIEVFSNIFPNEKDNIINFFEDANKAIDEYYQDSQNYGVPIPFNIIENIETEEFIKKYSTKYPLIFSWINSTLLQKLNEYFVNEDIKEYINDFFNYVGESSDTTPAFPILRMISFYLKGSYYTKSGSQRFVDSLKDFIEDNGSKILLNHEVEKIIVDNNSTKGVLANKKLFKSPIVVSTANAQNTYFELVGKENLKTSFLDQFKKLKLSPSLFILFLGVDIDFSSYPMAINDYDEDIMLFFNSQSDSSCAPNNKGYLSIYASASYDDFAKRGTKEYIEMKNNLAEELIKKASKYIPNLSSKIIVKEIATPKTIQRYLKYPKGATEGFEESVEYNKPYFKSPIKGLYLAGSSISPGSGIELAVVSGRVAAIDIIGWKKFKNLNDRN